MKARVSGKGGGSGSARRSEAAPATREQQSSRGRFDQQQESSGRAGEWWSRGSRSGGGAPANPDGAGSRPVRGGAVFDLGAVPAHFTEPREREVAEDAADTADAADAEKPGAHTGEAVDNPVFAERGPRPAALSMLPAPRIQRAARDDEEAAPTPLVVDDNVAVAGGQARKSDLLAELGRAACDEADRALREVGRDTNGCPQVRRWLSYYANRPAAHLERALRRYAPETRAAANARDYVAPVAQRIGRGAATWARTGRLPDDVPDEIRQAALGASLASIASALGSAVGGLVSTIGGAIGGLFRKGQDGAGAAPGPAIDPGAVRARLGPGRPLDGPVRARMESAFEYDFSRVRVHTDAPAAELSDRLRARAFTLGRDVAFATDQYRAGTTAGDALLAHELAHVVQQDGATAGAAAAQPARVEPQAETALEAEADAAAADAVRVIHGGRTRKKPRPRRLLERLSAPLRLQRCGSNDQRAHTSLPTRSEQQEVRAALSLPINAERTAAEAANAPANAPAANTPAPSEALRAGTTEWAGAFHDTDTAQRRADAERSRTEIRTQLLQGIQARFDQFLAEARRQQGNATGVDINRFEGPANAAKKVVRDKFGAWIAADATVGAGAPTRDEFRFQAGQNLRSSFNRPARERAGVFATPEQRVFRLATYSTESSQSVASGLSATPYYYNLERGDASDPDSEAGFFRAQVVTPFVTAHRAELDLITQFGVATTDTTSGTVFLPTAVPGGAGSADAPANHNERVARWGNFMTTVHEYLHLITHPGFSRVLGSNANAIEGFTEMFTAEVLEGLPLETATTNDSLRYQVEGDMSPASFALLPYVTVKTYRGYRTAAENARAALARRQGREGAENDVRAAYFQGHVELIGIDPQGAAGAEGPTSEPDTVTIPAGVSSIAALATAANVSAGDLTRANPGLTDAQFQAPQRAATLRLRVPGAREHVVVAQGGTTETREIIAHVHDVSVDKLGRANPRRNWAQLAAGDRVLIPKK